MEKFKVLVSNSGPELEEQLNKLGKPQEVDIIYVTTVVRSNQTVLYTAVCKVTPDRYNVGHQNYNNESL